MSDSDDFRMPRLPGQETLPKWRQNPAFGHLGLSPDSITALDASEQEEQAIIARLRERTALNRQLYEGANATIQAGRVEQHRVDQLSTGELREELEDAIANVTLAQRKVEDGEFILARANTSTAEAEARYLQHADLEQRISQFHVDRLRSGSADALPPDLLEARREQRDAADTLKATQNAYVELASELQAAQSNLEQASQHRDQCAVAIVGRYCETVASDIEITMQRLHDLRGQLLSITSIWLPLAGITSSLPVSDRVRQALRRQDERPLINEEVKTQARAYFINLQTNSKATFGD